MKKSVNVGLIALAILTLVSITNIVRAQQNNHTAGNNSNSSNLDYPLPFPGILPGHPLYGLKMARDKIISLFITDPQKKAEFDLLMSDKRVNAAKTLADIGKIEPSRETLSKSQNYLEMGIVVLQSEKKSGNNMNNLLDRFFKASRKHQEVITQIIQNLPAKEKAAFRDLLEREKQLALKITNLKKG